MINITKTILPDINSYIDYLKRIWETGWITNQSNLANELEIKLQDYLGVPNLILVNNGTIALQIAIKSLDLHGEIITTPFSYIATTSSIVWENCTPVFCDINAENFTVDTDKIESLITPKTSALLFTHIYGIPCNVEKISTIADKYNLKIIYDASHAFGVKYKGSSILNHGDISTISFHATKIFHTVEGGALITIDSDLASKIRYMRNFGHKGYEDYSGLGINGHISELHAAMGLCILPLLPDSLRKRKNIFALYDSLLFKVNKNISKPLISSEVIYNYSFYPILFEKESILLKIKYELEKNQIFPRRYFYPSLNKINYVLQQLMPLSEDISSRVLCLPLYNELNEEDIYKISKIIISNFLK